MNPKSEPPVPSVALSDALLFADPSKAVLTNLEHASITWKDALVLATPFWDMHSGKLNDPIDVSIEIPTLAASSICFDPDRGVKITDFTGRIDETNRSLLATARHIQTIGNPEFCHLCRMFPAATSMSLRGCYTLRDLCCVVLPKSLRSLSLPDFENLVDVTALKRLKELEELQMRGCWATEISGIG